MKSPPSAGRGALRDCRLNWHPCAVIARRIALLGLAAGAVAASAGCSSLPGVGPAEGPGGSDGGGSANPDDGHRVVAAPSVAAAVLPALDAGAYAVSKAVLAEASVVVVSRQPAGEGPEFEQADAAARALGVPLLLAGPELDAELERLGTRTVISYPAGQDFGDREVVDGPAEAGGIVIDGLPLTPAPVPAVALRRSGTDISAVSSTILAAAGIPVSEVAFADPRATAESVALVKGAAGAVLGIGAFGDSARFAARVEAARTLPELPGGGRGAVPGADDGGPLRTPLRRHPRGAGRAGSGRVRRPGPDPRRPVPGVQRRAGHRRLRDHHDGGERVLRRRR